MPPKIYQTECLKSIKDGRANKLGKRKNKKPDTDIEMKNHLQNKPKDNTTKKIKKYHNRKNLLPYKKIQ
jgi:hypothetical protein